MELLRTERCLGGGLQCEEQVRVGNHQNISRFAVGGGGALCQELNQKF